MSNLKEQAMTGFRWSGFSGVSVFFLQLIQMVILARLLNPSDFGLMAILLVVLGLVQCFSDMGLSNALIYKTKLTSEVFSSIFWLNLMAGGCLTLLVYFSSPIVAFLFKVPESIPLIQIFSFVFVVVSVGQPYIALMRKKLLFSQITQVEVGAALVALIISVLMAKKGMGVYALIGGQFSLALIRTLFVIFRGWKLIKIRWIINTNEIRDLIQFGMYQMGERGLTFLKSNVDKMLIGRWMGILSLGQYSVAYQLMSRPVFLFSRALHQVSFPILSKLQEDMPRLRKGSLQTIRLTGFILTPFYTVLAASARPVILVVLGNKWIDVVPIFQVLCVLGVMMGLSSLATNLVLALGRADIGFWINCGMLVMSIMAIWIGSTWGVLGMCWSLVLIYTVIFGVVDMILMNRFISLSPLKIFTALFPSILISGMLFFVIKGFYFVLLKKGYSGPIGMLIGSSFLSLVLYLLMAYWFQPETLKMLVQTLTGYRARGTN